MSSTFIALAALLYFGAAYGFVKQREWLDVGIWAAYALANVFFALKAYVNGN